MAALLKVIGRTDLADDPRFASPQARANHFEDINEIVGGWIRNYDKHEAMRLLADGGVPAGAVLDTLELSADQSMRERGVFVTVEHEHRGPFTMPGWPVLMSESPNITSPAPILGSDTEATIRNILGIEEDQIAEMRSSGII